MAKNDFVFKGHDILKAQYQETPDLYFKKTSAPPRDQKSSVDNTIFPKSHDKDGAKGQSSHFNKRRNSEGQKIFDNQITVYSNQGDLSENLPRTKRKSVHTVESRHKSNRSQERDFHGRK